MTFCSKPFRRADHNFAALAMLSADFAMRIFRIEDGYGDDVAERRVISRLIVFTDWGATRRSLFNRLTCFFPNWSLFNRTGATENCTKRFVPRTENSVCSALLPPTTATKHDVPGGPKTCMWFQTDLGQRRKRLSLAHTILLLLIELTALF